MPPNKNQDGQFTPVMDVQFPAQSRSPQQATINEQRSAASASIASNGHINNRPATMEYTRPRLGAVSPSTPLDTAASSMLTESQSTAPKKSKKKLLVGALIVVVVGVLAAAATYYFMVINKKPAPQPVAPAQPAVEAPAEDFKAETTPEGIDKALSHIDKQLNSLNDDKDYSNDDVSDAGLGL